MDYLKYKTIKFHNEYKNRKKALNDTMNNAYTECSDKTAPTYASEAMRSRSGKTFVNKNFEYKKSHLNTIDNSDSNRPKDFANKAINSNYNINNYSTKNSNCGNYQLNYSNVNSNFNNNCENCYSSSNASGNYIDFSRKVKDSQSVKNAGSCYDHYNKHNYSGNYNKNNYNFEIARRKIDEYMEEMFSHKNVNRNSKNFFQLL